MSDSIIFNEDGKPRSFAERKRLRQEQGYQKQRATEFNPGIAPDGKRLTYDERAALRKADQNGKAAVARQAAEREAVRQAAIPEHEKRRANNWRETYNRRKSLDGPQNQQILRDLKKKADEEDRIIDAEMVEKKRLYTIASDPSIQEAVADAERHLADCEPDEKVKWTEASAIANEGDKLLYWKHARQIIEAKLQRQLAARAEHDAKTLKSLQERQDATIDANRTQAELDAIPVEN